jgi:hypothetical protein
MDGKSTPLLLIDGIEKSAAWIKLRGIYVVPP